MVIDHFLNLVFVSSGIFKIKVLNRFSTHKINFIEVTQNYQEFIDWTRWLLIMLGNYKKQNDITKNFINLSN